MVIGVGFGVFEFYKYFLIYSKSYVGCIFFILAILSTFFVFSILGGLFSFLFVLLFELKKKNLL